MKTAIFKPASMVLIRPDQAVPLDPTALTPLAERAERALLAQGESANTRRSYQSALRYWAGWYQMRFGQAIALPVPEGCVIQFIVDHAQRVDEHGMLTTELPSEIDQALVAAGVKGKLGAPTFSTLSHRVSVLSRVHQLEEQPNPCQTPRVKELLSRTRRGYASRGEHAHKKPALTKEPLAAVLETCDDSLTGVRDRALLLFAFSSGGRRRSEVTAATWENVRREGDHWLYTLRQSKTNQFGLDLASNDKPIAGAAARALTAWQIRSKGVSGPIFRRVRRGNTLGEPLQPSAVRDIVKRRCALAGLSDGYSAHSLRSGFVTEAGRQQVPLGETMALTGHRTTAALVGYFRAADSLGRGATLIDGAEPRRGTSES